MHILLFIGLALVFFSFGWLVGAWWAIRPREGFDDLPNMVRQPIPVRVKDVQFR